MYINDLYAARKSEVVRLDERQDPTISGLQQIHFKSTNKLKAKVWKKM